MIIMAGHTLKVAEFEYHNETDPVFIYFFSISKGSSEQKEKNIRTKNKID